MESASDRPRSPLHGVQQNILTSAQSLAIRPAKKRRSSEHNYYKGIRKRPCICLDKEECNRAFHNFVDAKDGKRCGYLHLPSATEYKNAAADATGFRKVVCHHLYSNTTNSLPKHGKSDYIGFWHFNPDILEDDNKGPLDEVDGNVAKALGFSRSDVKNEKRKTYYPAPSYTHWKRDAESAQATMDPVQHYFFQEGTDGSDESDDSDDSFVGMKKSNHRAPSFVREVQATQHWVELVGTLAASIEIVNLRHELDVTQQMLSMANKRADRLAAELKDKEKKLARALEMEHELEKMGGLTRKNATCPKWHERHPSYAKHFWGLGSYDHTKNYISKVWWPDIKADVGGGTSPLTEFEEVLICLMRIHRAYHVKTLGSIWGYKSEGWATKIFQKWMPRLGTVGLHMSILDRDFMLDYISADVARRNNLPHSSFIATEGGEAAGIPSYAKASLPKVYREKGYERVGAIVDGKVFMTDTVRINSSLSRLLYADKVDNSGGLVVTWSSPIGLVFEHTGLYFARCPETRLIELWGTVDPEKIRFATEAYE